METTLMKRIDTALPDVCILESKLFEDPRGHFFETYREDVFRDAGVAVRFVQDNQSFSRRHVLRGLHYQLRRPQAKLVRVVQGEIFDVAVDIRRGSPTFGRWAGEVLSASNRRQMFVPVGHAHGFLVLSETAEVLYKCSDFYAPGDERGVAWNDPKAGVAWPLEGRTPILNSRDASFPPLAEASAADLPS
jgi:dTDP-4-dehydrorhamnose 3,5-epimerase